MQLFAQPSFETTLPSHKSQPSPPLPRFLPLPPPLPLPQTVGKCSRGTYKVCLLSPNAERRVEVEAEAELAAAQGGLAVALAVAVAVAVAVE